MTDMPKILYADEQILVCVKPVGCLSEPCGGRGLPDLLFPEYGETRTVHRLDKNVGGITVLARSREAAASLIGQIERREVEKTYLAVVCGVLQQTEGRMDDLLFHDARTNKTFVVNRRRKGVRDAALRYRVLASAKPDGRDVSLVAVRLETGRTHQIRVQFASRHLPLLGDVRYGSRAACDAALFAFSLAFTHPGTGKRLTFTNSPPPVFPWTEFPLPDGEELTF